MEVAKRGKERCRPEDGRQEDEENDVWLELRDGDAWHEPDEKARRDLEDRRRDRKAARDRGHRNDDRSERYRKDDRWELPHRTWALEGERLNRMRQAADFRRVTGHPEIVCNRFVGRVHHHNHDFCRRD